MIGFKCEACGGTTFHHVDHSTLACDYCGSKYLLDENEKVHSSQVVDAKMLSLFLDADKARKINDVGKEIQTLAEAVELDETSAIAWVKLGRAYRTGNLTDRAIECYEKAKTVDANYPQIYANLGGILLLKQEYSKAMQQYEKCLSLMDKSEYDYPTVLANYALAVGRNGDKKKAEQLLEEAESKGYKNAGVVRKQLGISLFGKLFG